MANSETWTETAAFWGYRALSMVAPAVPEPFGRMAAATLGSIAHRGLGRLRATVAANQARVLGLDSADPRVARSTRDAFRLYARYWYDSFHLRALTPGDIAARVDVPGLHHFDTALRRGKGCVAVLPHAGNWDVAGRVLAVNGYRLAAVAEGLRPARLAALFRRRREELGIRIVTLGDARAVRTEIERLLADNWIVALLADRALSRRAVEVEMFGATRAIPAGPAVLTLATGASMIIGAVYTTPTGWHMDVGAPIDPPRSGDTHIDVLTRSRIIAAELERLIARAPADWHLFQPGWDVDPAPTERRDASRDRTRVSAAAIGRP